MSLFNLSWMFFKCVHECLANNQCDVSTTVWTTNCSAGFEEVKEVFFFFAFAYNMVKLKPYKSHIWSSVLKNCCHTLTNRLWVVYIFHLFLSFLNCLVNMLFSYRKTFIILSQKQLYVLVCFLFITFLKNIMQKDLA